MLTASMDRLTDFGGQAYAPRKSKEFCAANGVSCSRKHTLLCSDEHNNPLLKRMLFTWVFLLSMPLALVPFVGAKILRQIRLDNSHQPPLAATLRTNAVRNYAFVNAWVHECTKSSVFPLLEALKFQVSVISSRWEAKLSTLECISDLMARYFNALTNYWIDRSLYLHIYPAIHFFGKKYI